MSQLEFWFEFASTYSYPSAMRIQAMAEKSGIELLWRPFLLGPIFKDQGWADSPFNLYPNKGRYMWRDLERICADQGIAFTRPTVMPRHGLLAARLAIAGADQPWLPDYVRQVYQANFVNDLDIGEPSVLRSILSGLIDSPDELFDRASSDSVKDRLRAQTESARRRGIFGSPSFVVGQELFWGDDRLGSALRWAASANSMR